MAQNGKTEATAPAQAGPKEKADPVAKIMESQEQFKTAVFKELEQLREQNAMLAQATATLADKVASISSNPQAVGQAAATMQNPWTALLLRGLIGDEKKSDPVRLLAEQTENVARIAEAVDRIRSPLDVEGMLAKRLLWRQGLRATAGPGLPRYMTKEELRRYDKYLNQVMGLDEFEGEGEGEQEHLS